MALLLALLTVAGALVYFNYYPRVTVYFIHEFQILNSVELKKGNALPNLPKPVKVGSRFLGWYTDADYKTLYDPNTMVKDNLELFAKFEKIEYHLQYRINSHGYNAKIYDDVTAYYADAINIPTGEEQITIGGATRSLSTLVPGYDFVGWTLSADGTGDVISASTGFSMLASDTVLYAKWLPKRFGYQFFNVLYDNPYYYGYPTFMPYTSLVYTFDQLAYEPEIPTVEHYTFEGWYYDESFNRPVDWGRVKIGTNGQLEVDGYVVSGTQLIFGKFKMHQYKLSYDVNAPVGATVLVADEADIGDRSIYYGMTVTRISKGLGLKAVSSSDNSKELYKFKGWNTKADGTGDDIKGDFKVSGDENITLYAMWERYYYLTFINEGEVLDYYNYKLTVGEHYTLPTVIKQSNFNDDVVKTGYHFDGWALTNNGDVLDFEYVLEAPGDVTFFAVWKRNEYTVHIGLDGGTANPDVDLNDIVTPYGSSVPLPNYTTSVIKVGYQMRGWKVLGKNGLADKILKITGIGTNETFTLNSQNIGYSTQVNGVWVIDVVPNFIEEITITYDANGGEGEINSDTKLLGQAFRLHSGEGITKQYYQLQGWSTTNTGEVEYALNADATFDTDTTLYAVWKAVEYKVQVIDKGHTGNSTNRLQPLTLDVENPLQLVIDANTLGITVREGYSLIGLTADAKNINISAEYVVENSPYTITVENFAKGTTLTLYTVITRNQYTVQWMVNGEPYGETQTVAHGSALTHPADPVVAGYKFQYWALADNDQVAVPNKYSVTSNMQLQAIFEKDVITLSFVYLSPYGERDNALNSVCDYEYESVVTEEQLDSVTAKLPTITGYQFDAWYATQNPTASSVALSAGQAVVRKLTYYSHYNAVDVSLAFRTNEGTGSDYVLNTKYDAKITLPNATTAGFECAGKVLTGWKLNNGTHVGDVDSEYTIKWDTNTILVAEWKDLYTLTYSVDADTAATNLPAPEAYVYGTIIVIPTNITLTKTGLIFGGKWTDQNGNIYVAGTDSVTLISDITLTPIFGSAQVTAEYQFVALDGKTYTLDRQTHNYGDTITPLELTPAQQLQIQNMVPNHRIDGWALSTAPNDVVTSYIIKNDTTFVLKLSRYYRVAFNRNGGDSSVTINSQTFVPNEAFTLTSQTFTRKGYAFTGWATTADGEVKYRPSELITLTNTSDVTLFAQWEVGGVTAVFDINNGISKTFEIGGKFGGTINLPDATSCSFDYANHRLVGWYSDSACTTQIGLVGDSYTLTSDEVQTLYAKWVDEYDLVLTDGNGDTKTVGNFIAGETYVLPADGFNVVGKELVDWTLNGTHYAIGSTLTITSDMASAYTITLVANMQDKYYDVTFTSSNADITTPIVQTYSVKHGETIVAPAGQDSDNYRFMHYTDAGGAVVLAGANVGAVTQNMQFTAVYAYLYTITYTDGTNKHTDRAVVGDTLGYAGDIAMYDGFTRAGYTLVGYTDGTNNYAISDRPYCTLNSYKTSYTVAGDATLTAVFAVNRNITLEYDTQTHVINDVIYGDTVDLTTYFNIFTRENFDIVGWTLSGTQVDNNYQVPNSDVTLNPVWDGHSVVVTFHPYDGATDVMVRVKAGSKVTVPSGITMRDNYEFSYWTLDGNRFDLSTVIEQPITLVGEWRKVYTVSFRNVDSGVTGNLPKTQKLLALREIDFTNTLQRTGYKLSGWKYFYGTEEITTITSEYIAAHSITIGYTPINNVDSSDEIFNLYFESVWEYASYGYTINAGDHAYIEREGTSDNQLNSITGKALYQSTISATSNVITITDSDASTTYNITATAESGYTFEGLRLQGETNYITSFTMPANDIVIEVVVSKGTFKATYSIDPAGAGHLVNSTGADLGDSYTAFVTAYEASPAITAVANHGYKFDGWYVGDTLITKDATHSVTSMTGPAEWQARFVLNTYTYTVSANAASSEPVGSYSAYVGSQIIAYDKSLDSTSTMSAQYLSNVQMILNVTSTYHAVKQAIITTTRDNGSTATTTIKSSDMIIRIVDDTTTQITINFTCNGNSILVIYFDVQQYVVTYLSRDGRTIIDTQTVGYGRTTTPPSSVSDIINNGTDTFEGYRFEGWYTTSGLNTPFTASTTITGNTSVYSKWVDLYNVVFDNGGGSGNKPSNQTVRATDTINLTNTLTKSGYDLAGFTLSWGDGNVNTTLDNKALNAWISSMPATCRIQATPIWTNQSYTLNISTNDATRGQMRDSLNSTAASFVAHVQYNDIITVSGDVVTLTKEGADTSYATYTAIPADESWEFSGIAIIVDGVRTSVDGTYTIGDMSGKTWSMEFVFIAGHLTLSYTVRADYAGSGVTPVQVKFTIVSDGIDTAWVDLGALGSHITTNYTLNATDGMTFKIIVPRNSGTTHISMEAIAGTGYGITTMRGDRLDYVSSHSTQYRGILRSVDYVLGVKLRQYDVTIASSNYAYGTVGYSYTLNKVVDGYIVAETDKTYNASGAGSAYALTLPYGTKLTLTASTLAGHNFSNWTVGGNTYDSATVALNVTGATTYTATFDEINYTYRFVLKSGSNELVIDTINNVNTGRDITTRVEGALTPTNDQMTSVGLGNKWFDGWNTSDLYTDGVIIAGTSDVTIYAVLSDAVKLTINSINSTHTMQDIDDGHYIQLSHTDTKTEYKIKVGTILPTISNVSPSFGCHFVNITDNNGNEVSTTATLSGYIVPSGVNTINIVCGQDAYTIKFLYSDGTVWKDYIANYSAKYLDLISGLEAPAHLDTDPTKVYTFVGWKLSTDGDILTSTATVGDHEHRAVINVYPSYTVQQKYSVQIYSQGSLVYDELLVSGEQVALGTYAVYGKQLLYLSPNADDDGQATSSSVANLYAVNYLWVNGTPGYRIAYSGDHKTTLTVGSSNIKLYAIYADIYTIDLFMDTGIQFTSKNHLAGSVVNLNYYTALANEKIGPHYEVKQISNISSDWDYSQFTNLGTTPSDADHGDNLCNPDAQLVINGSLRLSFKRRQLSKNIYIYSDETKTAYRVAVVGAGDVLNTAINAAPSDNYNVLPYYWKNSTWNSIPSLDTSVWNMPGYSFVGYVVEGSTTLYNSTNINSLTMGASDMVLICQYRVNNYNLQLLGDMPNTGVDNQAHVKVTYTSRTAGGDNEVGTLTTTTVDINHSSNRNLSVAYGTDITIEVFTAQGIRYNGLTYTGDFLNLPNTTSTKFTCSITQDSTITFNYEVVQLQITLSETRNGSYNGDSGDKVGRWLLDGSEVNTLSVLLGSKFSNTGIVSYYNWNGDSTEHSLTYQVYDGKYYKFVNYSVDGTALDGIYYFEQENNFTLSANISRTYNIKFSADGATNVPSSQVVTADEDITLTAPSRTGRTFLGWTTTLTDGTTITTTALQTSVQLGTNDNSKYDITFTAMWEGNPVVIAFGIEGNAYGSKWTKDTHSAEYGDHVRVEFSGGSLSVVTGSSSIIFSYDNTKVRIASVKVGDTTYTGNTTFTIQADTNITAVVEPCKYTLTLVSNGTNYNYDVEYGQVLMLPTRAVCNPLHSIQEDTAEHKANVINVTGDVNYYDYLQLEGVMSDRITNGNKIYDYISGDPDGEPFTSTLVTGSFSLYVHWEDSWQLTLDMLSHNPLKGSATAADSTFMRDENGGGEYNMFTIFNYRAPISEGIGIDIRFVEKILTADTINNPMLYTWKDSTNYSPGGTYMLRSILGGGFTYDLITMSSDYTYGYSEHYGNNLGKLHFVVPYSASSLTLTAEYTHFIAGYSLKFDSNDYNNNGTEIVGATVSSIADVYSYKPEEFLFVGENIFAKMDASEKENAAWIFDDTYREYYVIWGFSQEAGVVKNYLPFERLTTGSVQCRVIVNDAWITNLSDPTTCTMYTVWKTRDNSQEYANLYNGRNEAAFFWGVKEGASNDFTVPEWYGTSEGSYKVRSMDVSPGQTAKLENYILHIGTTIKFIFSYEDYNIWHMGDVYRITVDDNNPDMWMAGEVLVGSKGIDVIPNCVREIRDIKVSMGRTQFTVTSDFGTTTIDNANPRNIIDVGTYAAYGNTSLTYAEFSGEVGITTLEKSAFENSKIQKVVININIGLDFYERAFYNCSSLSSVEFGSESRFNYLKEQVFAECSSLTSIDLTSMNNTKDLPAQTFYHCEKLERVILPTNGKLTTLGKECFAFSGIKYLTAGTDNILPNSIQTIDYQAFYGCNNLENITLPSTITSLGEGCLYITGTTKLDLTMQSANVTTITSPVFYSRNTHLYFYKNYEPWYMSNVGTMAMLDEADENLTIFKQNNMHYISAPEEWFLTSVKSIDGVGTMVIYGLNTAYTSEINAGPFLEYLVLPNYKDYPVALGGLTSTLSSGNANAGVFNTRNVVLPRGCKVWFDSISEVYDDALAKKFVFIGMDSLVGIYNNIGRGITYSEDIYLDGGYVFGDYWGSPTVPKKLEVVDLEYAVSCSATFANITTLKRVNLPKVQKVDLYQLFFGCSQLTSVNLGVTASTKLDITFINDESADGAFANCTNLTNLNIGNIVTPTYSISYMFSGCEKLPITSTLLDDIFVGGGDILGLSSCEYAFENCYSMQSVPFLTNNQYVGSGYAKMDNVNSTTTSIIVSSYVTEVGDYVFTNMPNASLLILSSVGVTLPSGFTNNVATKNDNDTAIRISGDVTIEAGAFGSVAPNAIFNFTSVTDSIIVQMLSDATISFTYVVSPDNFLYADDNFDKIGGANPCWAYNVTDSLTNTYRTRGVCRNHHGAASTTGNTTNWCKVCNKYFTGYLNCPCCAGRFGLTGM